ncbi:crossover junction endodeoxyribonuclease RuvC [Nonomuraea wenchangensis]|uniref:Holliday junction resolvasome RuvABC endonuclease subunit n=1 Tax=Nonomuraea wenchangensis TaxID=568860 RepID=A0A1I0LTX5_9ACTN|nr:crossover junction endodeoxyribonuclease RuvC [Nonomuraea wenchangensis]SEU46405.1 Holliday junction resolvasome RuvABC endonuclease subunit [Nonomuraea wenchangensis]
MTTPPCVAGLDQAAEKTGLALPDGSTRLITAPRVRVRRGEKRTLADNMRRMDHVDAECARLIIGAGTEAIGIEDYAFTKQSSATHRLAEIGGSVRLACWRAGIAIAVINIKHLKQYATGDADASKKQMGDAALRFAGARFPSEDECDAAWARWLILDRLGHPEVHVPDEHRHVLDHVTLHRKEGP